MAKASSMSAWPPHITAAAPGGPRYDASLTREERRHQSNGIWLCQIHAKQIDDDEKAFKVETLKAWKEKAEGEASAVITRLQTLPPPDNALDQEDLESARRLGFSAEVSHDAIKARVREAACADIAAFKSYTRFPQSPIALDLILVSEDAASAFNVAGLAIILSTFSEVVVIAGPGTGKTTTAVQLVDYLLSSEQLPAIYVPVGEWVLQGNDLFQTLLTRKAFLGLCKRDLMLLAQTGQLALVLDGWNELDDDARRRASAAVKALQRDYSYLRLVVCTRQQAVDVPLRGPIVKIQGLSEAKQFELAQAIRGDEGAAILDHAWRTPGLRELVSVPLYLTSLVGYAQGSALPTTKEEVLRIFVEKHEKSDAGAEKLYGLLFHRHKNVLIDLAVHATGLGRTVFSETGARSVISTSQQRLVAEGQLSSSVQPAEVIAALVAFHTLIRSSADNIGFQHQQFQEWYASFDVAATMQARFAGDETAQRRLREQVLNLPAWEEGILFACERVSRSGASGAEAISLAIQDAMEIDPLLAAEMIYRSDPSVWTLIAPSMLRFVQKWHVPGRVDRAVHFMISSGRPDFSDEIWRLISDPDTQIHLPALRAGRRFRTSALGPDVRNRLAPLPEDIRAHVLGEIATQSGMDGLELATDLAYTDASPKVKKEVLQALAFRRADRFFIKLIKTASDDVWQELGARGYADEIGDQDVASRLREFQRQASEKLAPMQRLLALEHSIDASRRLSADQIGGVISSPEFGVNDRNASWAVQIAFENYPDETCRALLVRLERGMEIPFRSEKLLQERDFTVDDGPLATTVFSPVERDRIASAAACVVGPVIVGRLIDRFLAVHAEADAAKQWSAPLRSQYSILRERIASTSPGAFIDAILARADTEDAATIGLLAEQIARHGSFDDAKRLSVSPERYRACVSVLERWASVLVASQASTRSQLSHLAQAIERLPDPELVPSLSQLLSEEIARHKVGRAAYLANLKNGRRTQDDSVMSWNIQYRRAFSALGGAQIEDLMRSYLPDAGYCGFGETAALVLKDLYDRQSGAGRSESGLSRSAFIDVKTRRAKRYNGQEQTSAVGLAIFETVTSLSAGELNEEKRRHVFALMAVACLMPYSNNAALIAAVLGLPGPLLAKQHLLKILAMAGEVISADMVIAGIEELLEDAKSKSWLLDKNSGRLDTWLELLPFTDRPEAIFDVLGLLDTNLQAPYNLGTFLSALGYTPSPEADEVLLALATRDSRFWSHYEWLNALERRGTIAAGHILADGLRDGKFDANGQRDSWSVAQMLGTLSKIHLDLRRYLYQCFTGLAAGPGKHALARAIAEAPDTDGVILLVHEAASDGRPFNQSSLYEALRNLLTGHQTSGHFKGMQETFGLPAADIRRRLFALVPAGDRSSGLAVACLKAIEEIHEHYGSVDGEPRHPDVSVGIPWPIICDWR